MTDVMFPNGSPDLVEPIYKNPLLSAPFNEQLAAVTCAYVHDRLQVSCTSGRLPMSVLQWRVASASSAVYAVSSLPCEHVGSLSALHVSHSGRKQGLQCTMQRMLTLCAAGAACW